jgi:hypothetical protein
MELTGKARSLTNRYRWLDLSMKWARKTVLNSNFRKKHLIELYLA